MARKVFFSFHFDGDHWRASQVRNIGVIEGNSELSDNDWEAVKRKGNTAVENWIDGQLSGRSCAIVLVGAATAGRPWIDYEIKKAWQLNKGLIGIRIHKLLDRNSRPSQYGSDPFSTFNVNGTNLSSIVTLFDPPGSDSKAAYSSISSNIDRLVQEAIDIRSKYK